MGLGECWAHCEESADTTTETTKQACLSGLWKNSNGKCKWLSYKQVMRSDLWNVCSPESKSMKDQHKEMDGSRYEGWFGKVIPCFKVNVVTVMENALYHAVMLEKISNQIRKEPCPGSVAIPYCIL
jgi:hypothetical protein